RRRKHRGREQGLPAELDGPLRRVDKKERGVRERPAGILTQGPMLQVPHTGKRRLEIPSGDLSTIAYFFGPGGLPMSAFAFSASGFALLMSAFAFSTSAFTFSTSAFALSTSAFARASISSKDFLTWTVVSFTVFSICFLPSSVATRSWVTLARSSIAERTDLVAAARRTSIGCSSFTGAATGSSTQSPFTKCPFFSVMVITLVLICILI